MNEDYTTDEERRRSEAVRQVMAAQNAYPYSPATPGTIQILDDPERYELDPGELVARTALATFSVALMVAVVFAGFNGHVLRYPTLTWLAFMVVLMVFTYQVVAITKIMEGNKNK